MTNILVLVALIFATYTDMKDRTIPNFIPVVLIILVTIYHAVLRLPIINGVYGLFFMLLLLISISIIAGAILKSDTPIGGGDIKLLSAISFTIGAFHTLVTLFISQMLALAFAILYMVCKRQSIKTLPLAPFILIAYIIVLYLQK